MDSIKLGKTAYFGVLTSVPTGEPGESELVEADSLPTFTVYEDGEDTPILTGICSKITGQVGRYVAAVALLTSNGFEAGRFYNVHADASVAGVAVAAVVAQFTAVTADLSDLFTQAQAAVATGQGIDTSVALIDAYIGTQLISPKPSYSIPGQSYDWPGLYTVLMNMRRELRAQQIADEPFELTSIGSF